MHKEALLILLALAAPILAQGELPPDLEARIRKLENKASRVDGLEARVQQLQSRLRGYEEEAASADLERSVAAILEQDPTVNVGARKAQWLTIGGQLRLRTEYRTVSLYGVPDPRDTDEDFTIQRTRVNFDARIHDDIRVFVEIQDSRTWGEELGVLGDLEGVDLHQGYIDFEELFGTPLTFRAGRFELTLWNQRLISPLDWHPVGRAWDGIIVFGDVGDGWNVSGGYQIIAEDPRIDSDQDTDLYWAQATYTGWEDHEIGGIFLWFHGDTDPADFSFGTFSLHFKGKTDGFDYNADAVAQFGDNMGQDVKAWAAAAEVGYTFDCDWSPRVAVEWTWASGDEDPTDGDFETFNPLFPFGHYYQGFLDVFAWKNGHDLALRVQAKPGEGWSVEAAFHSFWLDETADSWYGASGAPIRTAPGASEEHVGLELDLSAKYRISPQVWLWFGYSHFFTGDYVDETGRDPDTDWLWLQVTADF